MNEIPLSKLDPKLTEGTLVFDCPACGPTHPWHGHKIRVGFDAQHHEGNGCFWEKTGTTIKDLTLTPSIDGTPKCNFHGWVTNGKVTWP
jgi:hypothetical protein